jgi:5-carboxymethyl-2-hydroxymuconate isomerase
MPHCIIELSEDIKINRPQDILSGIHDILIQVGGIKSTNIKSRIIPYHNYLVNQGDESFVALTLRLLPGRSPSLKAQLGEAILTYIKTHMEADKFSVEIIEIEQEFYFK